MSQNIEDLYSKDESFNLDWVNTPNLLDIKDEVENYNSFTSAQMSKIDEWHRYRDGQINFATTPNKSKVVKKLIKKSNEWRYPSIEEPFLSTNKLFELDSTVAYSEDVEMMNQILNYRFTKEMDRVTFINNLVRKCGDDGTVILKVSWSTKEITDTKVIHTDDFDMSKHLVVEPKILSVQQLQEGYIVVEEDHIIENRPVIEICDFNSIDIDPSCKGDLEKARAIVHRFETTLSDLKEDSRYHNLGNLTLSDLDVNLSEDSAYVQATRLEDVDVVDIPRKSVVVSEYWGTYDINNDGIAERVVISYIGNTIVRMEENPYPLQEYPFVTIQYIPNPDSVYGSSDADLLMENQDILSAIARGTIDSLARTAIGQTVSSKSTFDTVNQLLFDSGQPCQTENGVNPENAVHTVQYPELPQSVEYFTTKLEKESEALTGVIGFSGGISGNAMGDTATCIRGVMDAVTKRELSILRRFANGLGKMGRKVIRLNIEYLTDEDVSRITGVQEFSLVRSQYQPLTNSNIEIATPELNASRATQLSFMLQTIGNNMGEELRNKILAKINRLNGMEDLAHDLLTYKPQPDPNAQKLAELEVKAKEADIEYKLAQAEEARARASQYRSTADLKDQEHIDNVENKAHNNKLAEQEQMASISKDTV